MTSRALIAAEGPGRSAANQPLVFTAEELAKLEELARRRAKCAEVERETRRLVRELYDRGARPSQLAEVLGVTRATIHNWVKRP
jgi:DNA-directed RNA polymerase specialized sigma24 family protein